MPLPILIPARELFDEKTSRIIEIPSKKLILEHSLVSISRWESKWHKPYLPQPGIPKAEQQRSKEQLIDYVRCMTIDGNVDPLVYRGLTSKNFRDIKAYIEDPHTATVISKMNKAGGRDIITNELIYCWMTQLNIPFQPCEKWHLNHLMSLIEVCAIKSQPSKKMSPKEVMRRNHSLNAARRAKYNTRG